MKTIIALLLASCVLSLAQTGTDNSDSASDKTQQLLSAAKSGDIKSIRLLLDNGADINATNNAGGTALIYAAYHGHADAVKFLLDKGADINAIATNGWDALMFAEVADENQTNTSGLNASELLLEKDTGGINAALMYAASADHTNAMKLLLDEGADINVKDKYGDTLLIQAVSAGHTDVVKFLLDKGAGDINAALMKAVVSGDTNVVELLLARKADINTLDTDGSTALGIAQRMGNAAIAQLLRQAGATALSASDSSFNVAVASGTNTDSSGYVTNEALLTPFTLTNSVGDVITNAVLVKLTANKFVYKTDTGAMGMLPLASLPEDLRKKFGYAPQAAQAADEAEQAKKVQGQQLAQQQQELAAQQARWNAALETAMRNRNSVFPYGRVIQKISEGLLVSEGGTEDVDRPTILVKDYAGYDSAAADDWINFRTLFQVGLFSYSTVNNSENTIHAYTCSTNAAVEYYLEH